MKLLMALGQERDGQSVSLLVEEMEVLDLGMS